MFQERRNFFVVNLLELVVAASIRSLVLNYYRKNILR